MKHRNVLRSERDPVKRQINQHWREKYGAMILRGQEKERRAREEHDIASQRNAGGHKPQPAV